MAAVKRFMRSNDASHLEPFIKKFVTDSRGKKYVFETNPNTLYRLAASGGDTFEQVYRIIV